MVDDLSDGLEDGLPAPVNSMVVAWTDETGYVLDDPSYVPGDELHCIKYSLSGTNLLRNYDGANTCAAAGTVTIVARHVADIQFSRVGNFITVAITSSYEDVTIPLNYFIAPRAAGDLELIP